MEDVLIQKINQSIWWHVTPRDPNAYQKRGMFLASTYSQAEFYGRPNDEPKMVKIQNPVFGFSESEILRKLFGKEKAKKYSYIVDKADKDWYEQRIGLDAKMHDRAKKLGYDAIVLVCKKGKSALRIGRKPNSIELNLIYPMALVANR